MDNEFNISANSNSVIRSAKLFLWIAIPLLLFVFVGSIFSLIVGQANLLNALIALILSGYGLFAGVTIPLQIINQYNDVRVANEGLYVRIYIFRYVWKYIDWVDILEVRILPKFDRWGKSQWLIKVNKLTYWHVLISQHYGCGPEPGIVVNSDLIDGERLLKIVEEKLEGNR
jgi:hypothetical protein